MRKPTLLDNVSIVLVDTKTPGNIGATARCMMNMGLSRLILVDPPENTDNEALKLAAGAQAVLEKAAVCSTLSSAVANHGLVIGTSRHGGKRRKNIRTPREAAEMVVSILAKNRVAIVFGNEVNGLENRDLALCQEIVTIPSADAFPSLNLSHAVMVIAYELYTASNRQNNVSGTALATADELENFYHHLQQTLQSIGFLDPTRPERMMFSFRQIFGRARLDSRDVGILRGVLSEIERTVQNDRKNR